MNDVDTEPRRGLPDALPAKNPGTFPAARRAAARRATVALAALALLCALPAAARSETITRKHLDAGRVQYSGMDINGDEIPDSIAQDNLARRITYFLVDRRRGMQRIEPLSLPEEERRFIPDTILEADLDGDEVRDLLLYNRDYLLKYADNPAAFARILSGGIYLGHAKDTYRSLGDCGLSPEARDAVLERARDAALPRSR